VRPNLLAERIDVRFMFDNDGDLLIEDWKTLIVTQFTGAKNSARALIRRLRGLRRYPQLREEDAIDENSDFDRKEKKRKRNGGVSSDPNAS
jgi:hypothetical protein